MAIIEVLVEQRLTFIELLRTNQIIISVSQTLTIAESTGGPAGNFPANMHQTVSDYVGMSDHVRYSMSTSRSVTQTLEFTQGAWPTKEGYVYQNLTISQSADAGHKWPVVEQNFPITQTAVGFVDHVIQQTLSFTETVGVNMVRVLAVTDTLTFDQGISVFLPRVDFIAVAVPSIAGVHTTTLITPGGSMQLPSPDFGNAEELGQTRIQRQSRGGNYIIYRDPIWPTTDEFDLTFSYLNEAQTNILRYLVSHGVGKMSTYVDHEGNSWQGIITTPELEVTQVGRFNYTAKFKFLVVRAQDA